MSNTHTHRQTQAPTSILELTTHHPLICAKLWVPQVKIVPLIITWWIGYGPESFGSIYADIFKKVGLLWAQHASLVVLDHLDLCKAVGMWLCNWVLKCQRRLDINDINNNNSSSDNGIGDQLVWFPYIISVGSFALITITTNKSPHPHYNNNNKNKKN